MAIKTVDDIRPQRRNANKHSQRGIGQLESSVQSDGWIGAITVAAHGETFDGSARVEVAGSAGFSDAIIVESDGTRPIVHVRTDIPTADDPRAARLGIAANRVAEVNLEWDTDVLASLLDDGVDLTAFWHEDELEALLGITPTVAEDPGAQVDRAEELREKWGSERGQLWQIGRHRLLCGDSTNAEDVARLGALPEVLLFDPPWDADVSVTVGEWSSVLAFTDGRRAADALSLFGNPAWVFVWDCVSSWYTPSRPLQRMKICLWYGDIETFNSDGSHYGDSGESRTVHNSRGDHLFIPDPRGKHLSDLYSEPITQLHSDGPSHAKPVDWVRMLIADCTAGDVYDPFAGTGTTFVACEQIGRTAMGSEIDPATVAVALERMAGIGLDPRRVD